MQFSQALEEILLKSKITEREFSPVSLKPGHEYRHAF